MKLLNKVAVVTGGASGIGRAIALAFAREGADIVIADVVLQDAEKVAGEVRSLGRKALPVKTDVSDRIDVNRMVEETLKVFKKIDILVNNAGIIKPAPLENLSEEDWDRVIDVNLKGQFLCGQAVGRKMIDQKEGTIVNTASLSGATPELWSGSYSPSKAGVISLTQQMAIEWAKYNIRVNAISPGAVLTPLTMSFYPTKEEYERRQKAIPLGRFAEPEDIAKTVVFLASDESAYITGEIVNVDGGQQASLYYLIGKRGAQKEQ